MKKTRFLSLLTVSALFLVGCAGTTSDLNSLFPSEGSDSSSAGDSGSAGDSSSIGDSSSTGEATYSVSAAAAEHGSVTFDKKTYAAGDTVTITVTPDEGYHLASILADDADTMIDAVSEGKTYSFAMPSKNVIVTASFTNLYGISSFQKINWGDAESPNIDSVTLADGTAITTDSKFAAGSTVNLKINAGSNWKNGFYYENTDTIFIRVNDEVYMPTLPADYDHAASDFIDHYDASFVMPSSDADIYVSYNTNNYTNEGGHTVTVEESGGVKILGYNPAEKLYTAINLLVLRPENSVVTLKYQFDGETDWSDLGLTFQYAKNAYYIDNVATANYLNLTGNITIKASAEHVDQQKITYLNADKVTVTSDEGEAPETCLPGDRLVIEYTAKALTDYAIAADIKGVEEDNIETNDGESIVLTMPNAPITISYNVKAGLPVTFADNADVLQIEGIHRSSNDSTIYTTAAPSSEILLLIDDVKVDTGKMVTGAKMNDGAVVSPSYSYGSGQSILLTMPESGAALITIETANAYTITLNQAEGGTITLSNSGTAFAADTLIEGYANADSTIYSLKSLTVANSAGDDKSSEVKLVLGEYSSYSFTMPAYSVVLTPVWEKAVTYTATADLGDNAAKFASGEFSRSSITGSTSYSTQHFPALDTEDPVSFLAGEKLKIEVSLVDATVVPTLTINDGTNSTDYNFTSYSSNTYNDPVTYSFSFADYVINSNITLTFSLAEKATVKATIVNTENIPLALSVNGETVTDFSAVKQLDTVGVSTTADAGEGKSYGFTFTAADGSAMTANDNGEYLVTGDFTVEVVILSTHTLTINNANGYTVHVYDASDGVTNYSSGSSILEGSVIAVEAYDAVEYSSIHVNITIGGVATVDEDSSYYQTNLTVTGDIVITLTAMSA